MNEDMFEKLVKSIQEFPEMLEKRPIIVDENNTILGGNMRFKACKQAGLKKVWVDVAKGWTNDQKKEFIIKDNVGFGQWDWDLIANKWTDLPLKNWGLQIFEQNEIDLDNFFEDQQEGDIKQMKIVLKYNEIEYNKVIKILEKKSGTNEKIIYNLLVNE